MALKNCKKTLIITSVIIGICIIILLSLILYNNYKDRVQKENEKYFESLKTTSALAYMAGDYSYSICLEFITEILDNREYEDISMEKIIEIYKKNATGSAEFGYLEMLNDLVDTSVKNIENNNKNYTDEHTKVMELYSNYKELYNTTIEPFQTKTGHKSKVAREYTNLENSYKEVIKILPEVKDLVKDYRENGM